MPVKPIPDGFHSVTPYLYVSNSAAAIDFYVRAFNAREVYRLTMPGGAIGHAEVRMGDSHIMLADESPDWGNKGPGLLGGTTVGLCLYVEDVDALFAQAIAAGAVQVRPVADQFYGDRSGTVVDPFGHVWTLATHREDLTPAEIQARLEAWVAQQGAQAS